MKIKGPDGYLYEPVWLNTVEAEKRRIRNGDIVKIYNERGTVLGGAYVTERLMPRVAYMDHGSRWDPIIPGELDRGGAINTITPHNITSKKATGMVVSGFLVEVEKVTDEGGTTLKRSTGSMILLPAYRFPAGLLRNKEEGERGLQVVYGSVSLRSHLF